MNIGNEYLATSSEHPPLNSTLVVLILFNSCKQIISYDRAKLRKLADFMCSHS